MYHIHEDYPSAERKTKYRRLICLSDRAKKRSKVVCTFINDFLYSVLPQYKELLVHSEYCGGQSNNRTVVSFSII